MKRFKGFSLIELLIVIAILGILSSLGIFAWKKALKQQEEAATLHRLAGVFWQGTTRATSEGRELFLCKQGKSLTIRRRGTTACNGAVVYQLSLPDGFDVHLNDGRLLRFTPPGKIEFLSGNFQNPFLVTTRNASYQYRISLIGEVQVTKQ